MPRHKLYGVWYGMIRRCHDERDRDYALYGGRGIKVCDEWRRDCKKFFSDMGDRPEGMTLDRVNNDGNYDPSNCRWATIKEQCRNRRITTWLVIFGELISLTEVAEICGIHPRTIRGRVERGMPLPAALGLVFKQSKNGCNSSLPPSPALPKRNR